MTELKVKIQVPAETTKEQIALNEFEAEHKMLLYKAPKTLEEVQAQQQRDKLKEAADKSATGPTTKVGTIVSWLWEPDVGPGAVIQLGNKVFFTPMSLLELVTK